MTEDINTQSDMISTALAYGAFGWHVIPVHGIVEQAGGRACTCRLGHNCPEKMQGKHPVHRKWQTGHLMSRADVMATWDEASGGNPAYNIGILTGIASATDSASRAFFVLDIDPDNGGYETLARLESEHGPLPRTRTHRTGSGGEHRLFLVPDGMTIRNNQKRLGPGVDIRGVGGMIVAPPSVSGKGAYTLLTFADSVFELSPLGPAGVGEPPAWLVELLTVPAGMETLPTVVAEDLPDYADLSPDDQARVQRYAVNGLHGAVEEYFRAPAGRGNDQLYRSACAAIEIAQSPWNLITVDQVVRDLDTARVQRLAVRPGGGQDEAEFRQTVRSAHSAVIGQGRPLPPDPHPIDGLAFDVTEFLPTGDGVTTQEEHARPTLRSQLLTRSQLRLIPPAVPLIEGVLDLNTTSWLVGVKKEYKSFVALDWAAHVATGTHWRGKKVRQGRILYIAGEGVQGLSKRMDAWESAYGVQIPDEYFTVLPMPVQAKPERPGQLLSSGWIELIEVAREDRPLLIIVDTQARSTVGLEENSNTEMGVWVHAVETLKAETEACVMIVHHMGHNGDQARGASGLGGAMDAGWKAQKVGKKAGESDGLRRLKLSCLDMKDGDDSESMEIEMIHVEVPGTRNGSLVLKPYDPFDQAPAPDQPDWDANLTTNQGDIMSALRKVASTERGATLTEVRQSVDEIRAARGARAMPKTSFGTARDALAEKGLIDVEGSRMYLPDSRD